MASASTKQPPAVMLHAHPIAWSFLGIFEIQCGAWDLGHKLDSFVVAAQVNMLSVRIGAGKRV